MDAILAKKSGTKKATEVAGGVVTAVGAATGGLIGTVLMFGQELSFAVSDRMRTGADVRQMRMVPAKIYLYVGARSAFAGDVFLDVLDESSGVIARGTVNITRDDSGPAIVIARFPY